MKQLLKYFGLGLIQLSALVIGFLVGHFSYLLIVYLFPHAVGIALIIFTTILITLLGYLITLKTK